MDTSDTKTPHTRSECERNPSQDKVATTDAFSACSILVMRHGVPSPPAPKVFSQNPSEAEKRAIRISKRKASRWICVQHMEAQMQRVVAERDLEKALHQQTKLQMQREVLEARRKTIIAERAVTRARRRIVELETVQVEHDRRARMGELALQIIGLHAFDFVLQVAVGYVGGKLVRMADMQLGGGLRALLRR